MQLAAVAICVARNQNPDKSSRGDPKGSQTFVRARFAGFDSEKAASRACAALKKSAFACYTLRL